MCKLIESLYGLKIGVQTHSGISETHGKVDFTVTRPDIVYAIHILTQYITTEHVTSAKRLLKYLAGNVGQEILLASQPAA